MFKRLNKNEFGYFLAGLIDADGYLRKKPLAVILDRADVSLAYSLKVIFGGRVRFYKKRHAVNYELNNPKALLVVVDLIRNKLRLGKRVKQYNTAFAPSLNSTATVICNSSINNNHWLAGFCSGHGSFQIKLTRRYKSDLKWRAQVSLQFNNAPNTYAIFKAIKAAFGGSVGPRKSNNTITYDSGSLKNAHAVVAYFDSHPVYFRQRRLYALFRRAYAIIDAKKHLSPRGMEELKILQKRASALRRRGWQIKSLNKIGFM